MLVEQAQPSANLLGSHTSLRASGDIQFAVKRALDILLTLALLLALCPVLLGLALAVKLSSPGPIFYRWHVVGQHGRFFTGFKFRTMDQDADLRIEALQATNEMSGPVFKMRHDPRVTETGRFLRRFSLDELPQLWSVLKGDMSLVGPRPPLQREWDRFTPWHKQKLAVKPGITCLWQIQGRNRISNFDDWVKLDIEYIRRQSLWLDLKILILTIPAVFTARGAS